MKLKLLTPLLPLIVVTLALCLSPLSAWAAKQFEYTHPSGKKAFSFVPDSYTEEQIAEKRAEYEGRPKLPETEAEIKRAREICTYRAGKMNNEFAAKKLYKSCLADKGLKPESESKSWFDW